MDYAPTTDEAKAGTPAAVMAVFRNATPTRARWTIKDAATNELLFDDEFLEASGTRGDSVPLRLSATPRDGVPVGEALYMRGLSGFRAVEVRDGETIDMT